MTDRQAKKMTLKRFQADLADRLEYARNFAAAMKNRSRPGGYGTFRDKDVFFTCAFDEDESNLGKALSSDSPVRHKLTSRLKLAATITAVTAGSSFENITFDCIGSAITCESDWISFQPSHLREFERRCCLPEGETDLILEALATTPVYRRSEPDQTFIQYVVDESGIHTSLAEQCEGVIGMLCAASGWNY